MKHIGVKEGLSNNSVVDIAQDRQGCIWIATEAGLNKFDGYNFSVYTKKNSELLSDELNTLLFDEKENILWVGTQRNGISLLDLQTNSFKNLTAKEGIATNDITHLAHATDGGIWITHYHRGVEYYDRETKQLTFYGDSNIEGMKTRNWCSLDDGNGHLYVGHVQDGLSIIDIHSKTSRNLRHDPNNPKSLPGNIVRTIHIDKYNNIWLGTNQGLALFDPQTEEFITFRNNPQNPHSLASNNIFAITEMSDGTLWISTDIAMISIFNLNHLTLRNPEQIEFKNIVVLTGGSNVKTVFEDSFTNIWIGIKENGINFISKNRPLFQTIHNETDIDSRTDNKQIVGFCITPNQQLWIANDNKIVLYENNNPIQTIDLTPYLPSNKYISTVICDKEGQLWLGTYYGGILKYDPVSSRIERANTALLNDVHILNFYEDKENKMWISTVDGLYSCKNNIYRYEDTISNALKDKVVYSVLRDKKGKLWVGTFGKGIHIFDGEKLTDILSQDNGFCSNAINNLYMDAEENIWVATREGIAYFSDCDQPSKFTVYNDSQGIESSHIRAVLKDKYGDIWASTNTGISLLNKERKEFVNFNYKDDVPIGDYLNGSACIATNGNLYFASSNGICFFNPEEVNKKHAIAPIEILSCHGFNKNIESHSEENIIPLVDGVIDLPYNWNSFRITFAIPDFSQSQQAEYTYAMEGLEDIWYNTHGENWVIFRNIPPGRYIFKVKARLKNQTWEESSIATLQVHIHPPLWQTWYAKLFYISIICLVAYFFLHAYKKRLKLQASLELERESSQNMQMLNEERIRFYTNITHELRTPLTLIIGPLEDILNDTRLPKFYNQRINLIYDSAIRLLNLINRLLEFRKTETQNRKLTVAKGDIGQLITEVGLRYKELNQNYKVSFHIHIATKETNIYYDADIITTILDNLLSNAVKYTSEGEIRLLLHSVNDEGNRYTQIEVSDTGFGIDAEALPHIFERYYQAKGKHQASGTGIGLALVKSLAELHEGTLQVDSTLGKGTIFTFRILTENTYPNALIEEKTTFGSIEDEEHAAVKQEERNDSLPTILVIEDHKDIREYIVSSLTPQYQVITAENGKDGLALARQDIPDIIISDIMMPEMDGTELCRTVKGDIRTSHIPLVLLTAKNSIRDKEEGYESGADSYITKPFSGKLLNSCIHSLLESRRKIAERIAHSEKIDFSEENREDESLKISKLDQEFLAKLTYIIEENIDMEKLDINFCTEKMNMSRSTFYRKVKGLTGISANEFIRKRRLKMACDLLIHESYTISEVGFMTGFNDTGYFRQCFKDEYEMNPSEFIKKYGKTKSYNNIT